MRHSSVLVTAATAIALAACGSSVSASAPAGLADRHPHTPASQQCSASTLAAHELKLHAGVFGETHVLVLTNVGGGTCTVVGVPHLALSRSDGRIVYTPPQVVASHGATVHLGPHRSASFWVELLAPDGVAVPGAQQLTVAVRGVRGVLHLPLLAPDRASQQLIVSAIVSGVLAKLPRSVDTARKCSAPALSLRVQVLDLAAGRSFNVFVLRNITAATCSVGGVARLSIDAPSGRRLYSLPQGTGTPGSVLDLSPGGRASFWVEYPDCAAFGVGPLKPTPARQKVRISGIAGTLSLPGQYPRSWPRKCRVIVSAIVSGVLRTAPGFTG